MRHQDWELRPDGVWVLNFLPYLYCEVHTHWAGVNMEGLTPFKTVIIGANTVELVELYPSVKEAKRCARALMLDWSNTTTFFLARHQMNLKPITN